MKVIAALVAGIVLGSAGLAGAQSYWDGKGSTYSCKGGPVSVFCTETGWKRNYKTAIIPSIVTVSYGQRVIFSCKRRETPDNNCAYYGR